MMVELWDASKVSFQRLYHAYKYTYIRLGHLIGHVDMISSQLCLSHHVTMSPLVGATLAFSEIER